MLPARRCACWARSARASAVATATSPRRRPGRCWRCWPSTPAGWCRSTGCSPSCGVPTPRPPAPRPCTCTSPGCDGRSPMRPATGRRRCGSCTGLRATCWSCRTAASMPSSSRGWPTRRGGGWPPTPLRPCGCSTRRWPSSSASRWPTSSTCSAPSRQARPAGWASWCCPRGRCASRRCSGWVVRRTPRTRPSGSCSRSRCGRACWGCGCSGSTAAGGRARRCARTTSCGSGWPTSWAWTPDRRCAACTSSCSSTTRRSTPGRSPPSRPSRCGSPRPRPGRAAGPGRSPTSRSPWSAASPAAPARCGWSRGRPGSARPGWRSRSPRAPGRWGSRSRRGARRRGRRPRRTGRGAGCCATCRRCPARSRSRSCSAQRRPAPACR